MSYMVFIPSYEGGAGIGDDPELVINELGRFEKKQEAIDFIHDRHRGLCISANDDKTCLALADGEGNRCIYRIAELDD